MSVTLHVKNPLTYYLLTGTNELSYNILSRLFSLFSFYSIIDILAIVPWVRSLISRFEHMSTHTHARATVSYIDA